MITAVNSDDKGFRFEVKTPSGRTLLQSVTFDTEKELEQTLSELSSVQPITRENSSFN